MINCPKCGAENMIGAIFCRTCHAKLNLDELSPDAFDEPPEPASKKAARLLQRVLVLGIVLVLGGVLVALFWPVKAGLPAAADEAAAARAQRMVKSSGRFSFKSAEATAAVDAVLGLPAAGSGTRKPQHVSVEFLADGAVRLVLKAKLFGQIPMTTVLVGRPEVSGPGSMSFTVQEAKTGLLRGGDIGWATEVQIAEGKITGDVILGDDERRWLEACWLAACGQPLV
jgi:hypothetical protein